MSIVRTADGRKIIGNIENGTFTKSGIIGAIHMLHTPRGWGIDAATYKKQVEPYCHTIVIPDTQSGITYKVSTGIFSKHKMFIDRGFGEQYVLPIRYWQTIPPRQKALL